MEKSNVCLHELNGRQVTSGHYDKAVVGVGATE
jgi:hypothetical protein